MLLMIIYVLQSSQIHVFASNDLVLQYMIILFSLFLSVIKPFYKTFVLSSTKYTLTLAAKIPTRLHEFFFSLQFNSLVNPMGSGQAWSVYLITCLQGRLKLLINIVHILLPETDNCPA